MTLVPQFSQKPNARAKTRLRILADGPVPFDDLVGTRRDQAGTCGIPALPSWGTPLFLRVMTGRLSWGGIRKLCSCR